MKAVMTFKDTLEWELIITPETKGEQCIIQAMNLGTKCEVWAHGEDRQAIRITGEGLSHNPQVQEAPHA